MNNVADHTGVRVMAERCPTCIFRPGNLMHLNPGRVKGMLKEIDEIDGCIPCHETLGDEKQAICRGQLETHKTPLLRLAEQQRAIVDWRRGDA